MRTVWYSEGPDPLLNIPAPITVVKALSAGSLFPREPFECIVHSVYDRAVNMHSSGSQVLHTLVTNDDLMHPLAVLVCGPTGLPLRFTQLNLKAAQKAWYDGNTLRFSSGFEISFAAVQRVPLVDEIPPILNLEARDAVLRAEKAGALLETLQARQETELRWQSREGGIRFLPEERTNRSGRFGTRARTIIAALDRETPEAALSASLDLIGLGQGLTPAGDDFLCGLMIALQMRASSPRTSIRISALAVETWLWGLAATLGMISSTIAEQRDRTGLISKSFFYMASLGRFSSLLVRFAKAFVDPSQDICQEIAHLAQYGHSSGLDSATGFLYGMASVDKRRS